MLQGPYRMLTGVRLKFTNGASEAYTPGWSLLDERSSPSDVPSSCKNRYACTDDGNGMSEWEIVYEHFSHFTWRR